MPSHAPTSGETARAAWMRILALSAWGDLEACAKDYTDTAHDVLRPPETGLVMLRGRMGASGAAFNLGEATVTRCAVRLGDGTEGHAYVMGRSAAHAKLAAICDALLQRDAQRLSETIIAPLAAKLDAEQAEASTKAAATKVDFFTMVRGDD
ncbi:phosphonate C-P lyase system protein PhnG [Aestuariivirga sp.]|uniref:phosphonate C-P lyase system protein PhnG n=1 Tax=Aestuariivirga sp. TaxID=2650926 RepID=UPI0025B8D412|nr:phosphonate C-P lyase system protein PhnG [Aestuariivirga sp.]MCA3555353.1 phosphonate C-P lyase system protein PhnG [Aestuariivirga sp.]